MNPIWDFLYTQRPTNYTLPAQVQALVNSGAIAQAFNPEQSGINEGGPFNLPAYNSYTPNPAMMPKTQYGDVTSIRPYDVPSGKAMGGFPLKNPNLTYNDPFYGSITPATNTIDSAKLKDWHDYIGPLIMGGVLAGAGLGAFGPVAAGQSTALGLGQGAMGAVRSAATGNFNPVSAGLSIIPGLNDLGIPPEIWAAAKLANTGYSVNQALKQTQTQAPQVAQPPPIPVSSYSPDLFGDMSSLPAVGMNTQLAAKSIVPNAYSNSYGVNSQVIT